MISLIVFTDKYLGHIWTFYTNGFSLHSNYIQIHKYRGCRVPRLPQSFSVTGVHNSHDIKHFEIIFISRLSCFPATGSRDTLYRDCRMVPHEVKFRLPRRRDLPAIIRSLNFTVINNIYPSNITQATCIKRTRKETYEKKSRKVKKQKKLCKKKNKRNTPT